MEHGRLARPVGHGDADEDVVGRRLGVLDEDVEIAIAVEDAGVQQLEFRLGPVRRRFSSTSRA